MSTFVCDKIGTLHHVLENEARAGDLCWVSQTCLVAIERVFKVGDHLVAVGTLGSGVGPDGGIKAPDEVSKALQGVRDETLATLQKPPR